MTTPEWREPTPLDLDSLSVVDTPPDHVVPNHRASEDGWSTEDTTKPKRTVRERLMSATKSTRDTQPKPPKTRKVVPNKPGQFVQPVEDFYNLFAMAMMPFKPEVAFAIMSPAHPSTEDVPEPPTVARNCAEAWDEAAQKNETVRRFLDGFTTVGVFGKLLAAHTPILIAAMPAGRFNPASAMEDMLKRRAEQEQDG